MIELPETCVIADQIDKTLVGKTIKSTVANASPHSFAWYTGDPAEYNARLAGKKITGSAAYGGRPEMHAEDMILSFLDGIRSSSLFCFVNTLFSARSFCISAAWVIAVSGVWLPIPVSIFPALATDIQWLSVLDATPSSSDARLFPISFTSFTASALYSFV